MSIFTTFAKQSMINRLSNPINRNRSAAKISKVMSSNQEPSSPHNIRYLFQTLVQSSNSTDGLPLASVDNIFIGWANPICNFCIGPPARTLSSKVETYLIFCCAYSLQIPKTILSTGAEKLHFCILIKSKESNRKSTVYKNEQKNQFAFPGLFAFANIPGGKTRNRGTACSRPILCR